MNIQIDVKNLSKFYYKSLFDTIINMPFRKVQSKKKSSPSLPEKKIVALNNLSFSLATGDRLGIVGPNGAGKSTLLSILAGLTEASSGSVEVKGRVTSIMTLGLGLREELSGRENIYIDGEIQGKTRKEIDEIINKIIAFADLGEFINYPVKTYSTGMKARLAFAMIVQIDPEILVIDEALSVGDANFSQKATKKIKELCDRGKIVIIVSHSMGSVRDICNRCLWMDNGNIIMDGDPHTVTSAYLESVNKEDEVKLLNSFYANMNSQSYKDGYAVTHFSASKLDKTEPQTIFNTGDDVALKIALEFRALSSPDVRFEILRLDGLLITEALLSNINPELMANFTEIHNHEIIFKSLPLAWGIYKFKIQLLDGSALLAESSIVIEIRTPERPAGRPVLIYSAEIKPVFHENLPKEILCLDLIKAT